MANVNMRFMAQRKETTLCWINPP